MKISKLTADLMACNTNLEIHKLLDQAMFDDLRVTRGQLRMYVGLNPEDSEWIQPIINAVYDTIRGR